MSTMTSITVKDASNTDTLYTARSASSGDKVPAVWTQNAQNYLSLRPFFSMVTRDNLKRTGRVVDITFKFPFYYNDSSTGLDVKFAELPLTLSGTLPTNVDATLINNAFVEFGNLLVSTVIRTSIAEGAAPT
jgi:hypothetical protein